LTPPLRLNFGIPFRVGHHVHSARFDAEQNK
jgi:hypothetical protein